MSHFSAPVCIINFINMLINYRHATWICKLSMCTCHTFMSICKKIMLFVDIIMLHVFLIILQITVHILSLHVDITYLTDNKTSIFECSRETLAVICVVFSSQVLHMNFISVLSFMFPIPANSRKNIQGMCRHVWSMFYTETIFIS